MTSTPNLLILRKNILIFCLALVAFTGVFCLVTWPWIANFNEAIPGLADEFAPEESMNYADTYHYLGSYRQYESSGLSWKIFNLSSRSNLAILQLIAGEIPGYNLWWLASFVVAFLGCFALVWHLTKNYWGAFGAGLIFSLIPYHFAHSYGHSGAIWYGWLAFFVFFFLRYLRSKSKLDLLAGAFFLFLAIMADEHYALYAAVVLAILVIYALITKKLKFRDFLRWPILVGLSVAVVIFIFLFRENFLVFFSGNNWLIPPYYEVYNFSVDILAPLIPPDYHWWQGNQPLHSFNEDNYWFFSERSIYLGWTTLALSVLAVLIAYMRRQLKPLVIWIIMAVVFLILAFGTSLVLDRQVFEGIHLPYYWVYLFVPFFNLIRATGRIFVLSILGWSVLAGFGITFLISKLPGWLKVAAGIFLVLLIALDFSYLNMPTGRPVVSEFYTAVLASDKSDSRVLEIPASTDYAVGSMTNYYAFLSGHKKINSRDYSRTGRTDLSNIKNNPVLNKLAYELPAAESKGIIKHDWPKLCPAVLKEENIGYITLHRNYLSSSALSEERQWLDDCGCRLIFEDAELQAFQTAPIETAAFYLRELEFVPADPTALQSILVHNPTESDASARIDFEYQSKTYRERKIIMEYNGTAMAETVVPGFQNGRITLSLEATPGDTQLVIKYFDSENNSAESPHFEFSEINYSFTAPEKVAN